MLGHIQVKFFNRWRCVNFTFSKLTHCVRSLHTLLNQIILVCSFFPEDNAKVNRRNKFMELQPK